jgi:hypothetical protein
MDLACVTQDLPGCQIALDRATMPGSVATSRMRSVKKELDDISQKRSARALQRLLKVYEENGGMQALIYNVQLAPGVAARWDSGLRNSYFPALASDLGSHYPDPVNGYSAPFLVPGYCDRRANEDLALFNANRGVSVPADPDAVGTQERIPPPPDDIPTPAMKK